MLELIAIALLQLASFTNSPEPNDTRVNSEQNQPVIVVTPAGSEQGGGGWGGD